MRFRRTPPRWASIPFLAIGLYVLLISLDLLPYGLPARRRAIFDTPHHWQVGAAGIAFMAMGLKLAFPRGPAVWQAAIGLVALCGFFAPLMWLILDGPLSGAERVLIAVPATLGLVGVAIDVYQSLTGRPFDPHALDPLEAARVLRTHGRPEQAEAVLRRAMKEEPGRRDELQRAIDAMRRR